MLTGTLASSYPQPIILNVGGVGYAVFVPERLTKRLTIGGRQTLYVHTHVTDDAIDLFGFSTAEELGLFRLLLSVSGVGPRTALAVVDRGVVPVRSAVASADVDFFTTIPRLGKKNAQKIIIELKSKLGGLTDLDLSEGSSQTKEILEALTSMGFAKQEITEVIRKIDRSKSLKENIRQALKLLGK